jgi:hypothetical protein
MLSIAFRYEGIGLITRRFLFFFLDSTLCLWERGSWHRRNLGGGGAKEDKCPQHFFNLGVFWLLNLITENKKWTEKIKWKTCVLWDQFSPLSNLTPLWNKVPNVYGQFYPPPPSMLLAKLRLWFLRSLRDFAKNLLSDAASRPRSTET